MSSDLWDEYRAQFAGGFARLAGGTAFRNGYQSHAATETCPGHSTILTGSRPSRTGIIANYLVRPVADAAPTKRSIAPRTSASRARRRLNYTVSPLHLKVPTLGELMKRRTPASRNVAVGGKDRSAVMMGGQIADQRWYWNGKAFVTDLKAAAVPKTLAAVNTAVAAAIAAPQAGAGPAALVHRQVARRADRRRRQAGRGGDLRPRGRQRRRLPLLAGVRRRDPRARRRLFQEMQLGRGSATDILSIGLAGTDFVGHSYGTEGSEMCLQLFSLDRDLGDFFALLDRTGIDYAVVLTADHGGQDIPERLREQGVPERSAGRSGACRLGGRRRRSAPGSACTGPVLIGESAFGDIYLDRALKPADRARALDAAVATYRAHPQVEAVYTSDQLRRIAFADRFARQMEPDRARPRLVRSRALGRLHRPVEAATSRPIPDTRCYVATHGSPWDYDRRVPILFWRPAMAAAARDEAVETVDIMPTLGGDDRACRSSPDRSTENALPGSTE